MADTDTGTARGPLMPLRRRSPRSPLAPALTLMPRPGMALTPTPTVPTPPPTPMVLTPPPTLMVPTPTPMALTTTARGPLMLMPGATDTATATDMAVTAVMADTGTARGLLMLMLTLGATDTAAATDTVDTADTDTAASATTDKRVLGTRHPPK